MNQSSPYQLIILGGGLAGCLLFASTKKRFPHWNVLLCEKSHKLCGDHTWSFHASDLPPALEELVLPLVSQKWPAYEVRFPKLKRTLHSAYASIRSQDLAAKIESLVDANFKVLKNTKVLGFDLHSVQTENETLKADYVVDCRGWTQLTGPLGYQKFIGLELRFQKEHGLQYPILKDVEIAQTDGYRFVYSLPMSPTTILVEDTYYSNKPDLDTEALRSEVLKYAERFGPIAEVLHFEQGCLPLALSPQKDLDGGITLGARSQFYQPVTGYSLPQTLQMLSQLLDSFAEGQSPEQIVSEQKKWKKKKSLQWTYLMWLNKMLFYAAKPETRYQVLERFYGLNEGLIHRFYRGELTIWDRCRILLGKPPVPVLKAAKVLLTKNKALETTKV